MIRPETAHAIEQRLAQNDLAAAADVADRALAAGEVAPILFNLAAWRREEAGDLVSARDLLARAADLAPDDPLIRTAIATVQRKAGDFAGALSMVATVVTRHPDCLSAWLEQGYAQEATGAGRAAAGSFRRAVALDPRCVPALAALAGIAAREGDRDALRDAAGRALAIEPGNAAALHALTASDIEAGQAARAIGPLRALAERPGGPGEDRIRSFNLLGDAYDKLDEIDAAFAAYSQAKRLYAVHHAPMAQAAAGDRSNSAFVERLIDEVEAIDPAAWMPVATGPIEGAAAAHTFLLGYPRSGTTLLENILASVPGVEVAEERPTLALSDAAFLGRAGGLAELAAFLPAAADMHRTAYWTAVSLACGPVVNRHFVDMDPLKGLRLPIIARLFPDARILLIRRDPRDVVWSCFRQNFRFTATAYEFTDLARAASHYDAVMRLTELCRQRMPLDILPVDYAALVADFDATTTAVCRFLHLPWSENLRSFSATAKRRGVGTASATQVRHGLFDGGGQWRRYERHLSPIFPILEPWIQSMGPTA